MLEKHLKSLSEAFNFSFNHIEKSLNIDLTPPFSCLILAKNHLRCVGKLPPLPKEFRDEVVLKLMQLNLVLGASESVNISLQGEEHLTLTSDFHYELSYAQLVEHIEMFANHLDKLSAIIKEDNGKNA